MMRKFAWIVMTALVVLGATFQSAAGQDNPQSDLPVRYSVAFSSQGTRNEPLTNIASLNIHNEWAVTTIEGDYLGMNYANHSQYTPTAFGWSPNNPISPVWSPDGQTFYGSLPKTLDTGGKIDSTTMLYTTEISAFTAPAWQQNTLIAITPETHVEVGYSYTFTMISVSPDGRYGWAASTHDPAQSYLVELSSGETIREFGCMGHPLMWLPTEVVVFTSDTFCGATVVALNYETGAQRVFAPILQIPALTGPDQTIYLPEWEALLLGVGSFGEVAMLKLDGTDGFTLGVGGWAHLSPDGNHLIYMLRPHDVSSLMRLDLQTGVPEILDQNVVPYAAPHWNGDTLGYWKYTEGQTGLIWVSLNGPERTEQIVIPANAYADYSGVAMTMLPDGSRAAISVSNGKYARMVDVYENGEIIFSTNDLNQNSIYSLSTLQTAPLLGAWVWVTNEETDQVAALNLQTLEFRTPPEGSFVSISPDGAWWLYYVDDPAAFADRLVAYEPGSGKTFILWNGNNLPLNYGAEQPSLPENYLRWSPLNPTTPPKSGREG